MKLSFKSFLPHLVALVLFVVLPSIYFSPLYDGYALKQNDIRQFQGMSKEIFDYNVEAAKFIGDFGTLNDPKER